MAPGQKAETEHYEEIEDYDYNNPNDTSNFCPGLQVKGRTALSLFLSGGCFLPSHRPPPPFFFGVAGVGTQDLMHARHAPCP